MTCAICRTIDNEGFDETQINEELKSLYLGSNGKRSGAPAITHYFNRKILENIFKEKSKGRGMPLVKMSELYTTVRKVFDSEEISTEDYELMSRVFDQYGIDINLVRGRFTNRTSMWYHIKTCLKLDIKKISMEEFLNQSNTRIRYFKENFKKMIRRAEIRGIGGEGTSFEPVLVVICKKCDRSYPAEEFMREDFKCECAKEEGR
ncbi:MAG: rod-determining factor RdfA [Candidatus Methanoperedens sp.]